MSRFYSFNENGLCIGKDLGVPPDDKDVMWVYDSQQKYFVKGDRNFSVEIIKGAHRIVPKVPQKV